MSPAPTEVGADPTLQWDFKGQQRSDILGVYCHFSLGCFHALMSQNPGSSAAIPRKKPAVGSLGRCKDLALWGDLESLKSQPGLGGDARGSSSPPVLFPCSVPHA